MAHLVLIETTGNQRFIFATNRLRENAGASEIVYQAGTRLIEQAIAAQTKNSDTDNPYANLPVKSSERINRLVSIGKSGEPLKKAGIEIVVSTSGKAILLVKDAETGKALIASVTKAALKKFPGLAVIGVVGAPLDLDRSKDDAHDAIVEIHRQIEELKPRLASPLSRFPTLPFAAPCDSSGLPANQLAKKPGGGDIAPYSDVVLTKRDLGEKGFNRVRTDIANNETDIANNELSRSPNTLDKMEDLEWSAIVHADGNGFGALFRNFADQPGVKKVTTARQYFDLLRKFSGSLELCGLSAFSQAIDIVKSLEYTSQKGTKKEFLPIVPLVLGGDDLTVVMDGRQALRFCVQYQRAFEKATTQCKHFGVDNAIREVTGGTVLGSGAGIAIVKPHYPFHRAYELAEALISSAKKSKSALGTPSVSAIDFHVLFDNGATNLKQLRNMLKVDKDPSELTLRPYIVSTDDALADAGVHEHKWITHRKWAALRQHADTLASPAGADDGETTIPSTQLHMLREALHEGRSIAEARYKLIHQRYSVLPEDLYVEMTRGEERFTATWLLDAMEVMDLEQLYNNQPTLPSQPAGAEDAA